MPRAKPAKPGPKPRAGDDAADQWIQIRIPASEKAAYQKAAERSSQSLTDWIRDACDVKLGEHSPSPRGEITRACSEIEKLLETIRDAV